MSNVRQLYAGILMYCNDSNGYFPTCAAFDDGDAYIQMNEDWIYWEANRKLDDSVIAKYLMVSGEKLKRLLRCPSDSFENRVDPTGVALPGQGPYLYSYSMNGSAAMNLRPRPPYGTNGLRTKITQWRSPSLKILITEPDERSTAPMWIYADPLSHRHGAATPTVAKQFKLINGLKGINVSTAFMDGHIDGVDEDWANDLFQATPDAQ
jgi:hypothetical protein